MAKRRQSGDTAKRRWWREVVKWWQQRGQTVREICRSAEVKELAFYWWRRRPARGHVGRGNARRAVADVPTRKPADVRTSPAGPVRQEVARFLPVQVTMGQAHQPNSGVETYWGRRRWQMQSAGSRVKYGKATCRKWRHRFDG